MKVPQIKNKIRNEVDGHRSSKAKRKHHSKQLDRVERVAFIQDIINQEASKVMKSIIRQGDQLKSYVKTTMKVRVR